MIMALKIGEIRNKCRRYDVVISYHVVLIVLGIAALTGFIDKILEVFT